MKSKILLLVLFSSIVSLSLAQVPEFWYLDEVNPGQDVGLYADGANVQEGSFSCQLTLLQPEVPYLISDNFDVTAGDAYTFSIYYYDNDDRGTLKFYADFYDAGGNDIYGLDPVESTDAEEWQEVTWSGVVPDDAVEGYILIKFYDEETYVNEAIGWVDNVQFTVNSENLVLNGSFESWPGVGFGENSETVFSVYPNPVNETLFISDLKDIEVLEVRNVLGQVIREIQVYGDQQTGINFSDLEDGMYFISGFNTGLKVHTTKVLKK